MNLCYVTLGCVPTTRSKARFGVFVPVYPATHAAAIFVRPTTKCAGSRHLCRSGNKCWPLASDQRLASDQCWPLASDGSGGAGIAGVVCTAPCSSWLSEVRPAGPPRLCGRGGRCGSGSSGISGAGTRTYGVGTGGGCVCSTRGHVGVWQGGGNQGSISAAGCSGRVTDVGGQVTRPRGATRPPRAQTSSLARAGLAYRSMGSTCICS